MTAGPHPYDVEAIRARFPSLARTQDGRPVVFADAPAGTQVPEAVIEAVAGYYRERNANTHGAFATSVETDGTIAAARAAGAALLGCDPGEIVFGANSTTLSFALSRSLARVLEPGDEVVLTVLDHDANVAPWLAIAAERGARVRWVDLRDEDGTLDLATLDAALGPRTRIVAFTLASNALGTVTPAAEIARRAREAGAIAIGDAVHAAPHRPLDVRAMGVDVLFTSPYKFYGPHLGMMFGRRDLLEAWPAYKVRPQEDRAPERWETGTLPHELLAGVAAAVDHLAWVGHAFGGAAPGTDLRAAVAAGMGAVAAHEAGLSRRFLEGLPGLGRAVRLWGIGDPARVGERTPTFAVRVGDAHPRATAEALAARGVFVWDGDYYAVAAMERLGLRETGGAVRIGFCHYSTEAEVDRVLADLGGLADLADLD